MGKRGRKRKPGERYPSGKLKPTGEPVSPALWDRIRKDAIKLMGDPRLASELARLSLHKELTSAQTVAGFKVAEIYGAYERLEGIKRSSKSPSYESGLRGEAGIAEEYLTGEGLQALIARQNAIKAAFKALSDELKNYPKRMRDMLERLCVEDRAADFACLDEIRVMLERLAMFFGVTSSARRAPMAHRRAAVRTAPKAKPRLDLDRQAFIAVGRKLRPDLSDLELAEAHEFQRAIKARAVVRRSKGIQANVVYLPDKAVR